jgi:hypothetical protein
MDRADPLLTGETPVAPMPAPPAAMGEDGCEHPPYI